MELQCKERVDLLEALQESRKEADSSSQTLLSGGPAMLQTKTSSSNIHLQQQQQENGDPAGNTTWLGGGSTAPLDYQDLVRTPPLPVRNAPKRPSYASRGSSNNDAYKTRSSPAPPSTATFAATLSPPPSSSDVVNPNDRRGSRTPSPEKRGGMLRTLRAGGKERQSSSKMASTLRTKPPAASKAATQAWGTTTRTNVGSAEQAPNDRNGSHSGTTWDPYTRTLVERKPAERSSLDRPSSRDRPPPVPAHSSSGRPSNSASMRPSSPSDYLSSRPEARRQASGDANLVERGRQPPPYPDRTAPSLNPLQSNNAYAHATTAEDIGPHDLGPPDPITLSLPKAPSPANNSRLRKHSPARLPKLPSLPSYRSEYPTPAPSKYTKPPNARPPKSMKDLEAEHPSLTSHSSSSSKPKSKPPPPPTIPRKAVNVVNATNARRELDGLLATGHSTNDESLSSDGAPKIRRKKKVVEDRAPATSPRGNQRAASPPTSSPPIETSSDTDDLNQRPDESDAWAQKVAHLLSHLPKGVDEAAAKQILNEIVIQGDQVNWSDVAGLEIAKSALKETVVYPFLRPDLFMGLREPARGMLLFGPPGTGKTMLARAVATESKSTFFAISASSLTSKFLGESEKLVRALFTVAKSLAPSIIFVDEIDSLLSARGGSSEHEATRRIKTEFLIQWSDLAKAAAGRESTEGDASRVLVLAATNLPWAIDEAARRRFVRRQYIPLPEDWVRKEQLLTLLAAQKHALSGADLDLLIRRTDGELNSPYFFPPFLILVRFLGDANISFSSKQASRDPISQL